MTDTAAKESCSSALDDPRFEAFVNVLGLRGGMRKAEKASVVKFGKEGELLVVAGFNFLDPLYQPNRRP